MNSESQLRKQGYQFSYRLSDDSVSEPQAGDQFGVFVHFEGTLVGSAYFNHLGSKIQACDQDGLPSVKVSLEHRRKGIATAMYLYASQVANASVIPSQGQTPLGKAFWRKLQG